MRGAKHASRIFYIEATTNLCFHDIVLRAEDKQMNENDKALQAKVHSAMYNIIKGKGVASPAEVLIAIGVLSKEDYERWRFGKIDYLQRVCKVNLRKLALINREIRAYARKHDLKPSWTDYRKWGKGKNIRLRFSKTGDENIEKSYATHYVSRRKTEEAKEKQEAAKDNRKSQDG
jgi:hypothetical protein